MESFDAVVVGVGGWGSAAMYHLSIRGLKVCGVEQYQVGHDRGSSHGESRVIRMAYFLHPDYVPVLRRAYALWRELEAASGESLMHLSGLLCIGEPEGTFIQGLERCYSQHAIEHERLTPAQAMERFPQFSLPEDAACYWDPFGGYVRPDACIRAHVQGARAQGAKLIEGEVVERVDDDGDGVTISTQRRRIRASKVVLAGGAYTNRLLGSAPIEVIRKVLFWYDVPEPRLFAPERFPVWIAKLAGLNYYGFPVLEQSLMKAAEDTGGQRLAAPEDAAEDLQPDDEARLRPFIDRLFLGKIGARISYKKCLYENSVDRNFVVDWHPQHRNVLVAAGGSGHGYKFSSAIGEMAADLVVQDSSRHRPLIFEARSRLAG